MNLIPTPNDYLKLWAKNPLAFEQLKVIILERMLIEQAPKPEVKDVTPVT